jgi:2-polyprenyl-6-methoxyphenol hydroxylase-like FAD-dependent oxidoreductase
MNHNRGKQVLIIGGGIAGPALALFLQRAGMSPVIYEAYPKGAEAVGAFLNLGPNGMNVLETLGVAEAVRQVGFPCAGNRFYNNAGKAIGELEFNPNHRFGQGSVMIKRGLLHQVLRQAVSAAGIPIEFNKRLTTYTEGEGVTAQFEDGTVAHGDLLMGCDGLHSRVRQTMLPNAPQPTYTGVMDFGGFAQAPTLPPSEMTHMVFGKRAFFSYFVTPTGEIYWFGNYAQATAPLRGNAGAPVSPDAEKQLMALYEGAPAPIEALIGGVGGMVGQWPVYDMPPLTTWHRGSVCLVGDAAHATSPHLGQGASQSLEDAVVLAKCLRDMPTPAQAFAAYEQERKARAEALVAEARKMGTQKSPPTGIAAWFRDLLLPFFLKLTATQTAWIYDYKVAWE